MKRAHGCKYQHCNPEQKKTTRLTTVGPVKEHDEKNEIILEHESGLLILSVDQRNTKNVTVLNHIIQIPSSQNDRSCLTGNCDI